MFIFRYFFIGYLPFQVNTFIYFRRPERALCGLQDVTIKFLVNGCVCLSTFCLFIVCLLFCFCSVLAHLFVDLNSISLLGFLHCFHRILLLLIFYEGTFFFLLATDCSFCFINSNHFFLLLHFFFIFFLQF